MSASLRGVDAVPVRVEVDVAFGLPGLTIVGLPSIDVPYMSEYGSPMRTVVYARLSQDRSGESTGTARQVADCEAFAASRGWEVTARYVDADLSAFSGKPRPEYDRMLESIAAGEADVVLAWKLDRLLRRPREFETLWAVCEAQGANIATVRDGIDTTMPMVGKLFPRLMASFAELESESNSVRGKSKAEEIAKAGRHHGGGTRPFGLTADWSAVVPAEATIIREAADRVLLGETLRGVALDLNRRGVLTSTGREWRAETLRQVLVSPRVAGLREHLGTVVGGGTIPAILEESTWRRLEATLRHRNGSRGPQARVYLLSGFLRCSACGGRMVGHRGADRIPRYICPPRPRGCGGMKIKGEPLDELIREAILLRLDSPAFAQAMADHTRDHAERVDDVDALQDDEDALVELATDFYTERLIGRPEYLAARDVLEARIGVARSRLARQNGSGMLADVADLSDRLRDHWQGETLDWRRAVIAAIIDRIVIRPALRGLTRFDPKRVDVMWRH